MAALVAAPASLLAAWAAYAAGRAQGRSALDTARRTAQRESYAQLLSVSWAFTHEAARLVPLLDEHTFTEPPPRPLSGTALEACQQLYTLGTAITGRAAVVSLEGPLHIAHLARLVSMHAGDLLRDLSILARYPTVPVTKRTNTRCLLARLESELSTFAEQASTHLNAGLPARRTPRWWTRVRS